jgi:hypothetical protein
MRILKSVNDCSFDLRCLWLRGLEHNGAAAGAVGGVLVDEMQRR